MQTMFGNPNRNEEKCESSFQDTVLILRDKDLVASKNKEEHCDSGVHQTSHFLPHFS